MKEIQLQTKNFNNSPGLKSHISKLVSCILSFVSSNSVFNRHLFISSKMLVTRVTNEHILDFWAVIIFAQQLSFNHLQTIFPRNGLPVELYPNKLADKSVFEGILYSWTKIVEMFATDWTIFELSVDEIWCEAVDKRWFSKKFVLIEKSTIATWNKQYLKMYWWWLSL